MTIPYRQFSGLEYDIPDSERDGCEFVADYSDIQFVDTGKAVGADSIRFPFTSVDSDCEEKKISADLKRMSADNKKPISTEKKRINTEAKLGR